MKLKEYLKGKDRSAFARKIKTTRNYVNLLACGSRRPGPNLALRIEQETDGAVTLHESLFPDDKAA